MNWAGLGIRRDPIFGAEIEHTRESVLRAVLRAFQIPIELLGGEGGTNLCNGGPSYRRRGQERCVGEIRQVERSSQEG